MDFRTALAAGLANLGDREVLAMAAREGRVLVTQYRKSMPRHFSEVITTATSPGLLIIPQHLSVASAVEDLLLIWSATEAEDRVNRICFLPL